MASKYCPKCQQSFASTQVFCPHDNAVLSLPDPYQLVGRMLLDKYRIEALVGLGGMGAVYCAQHTGIERRVAFKILQPNIALADAHLVELFEREARVAGRLAHENIVDIKDAGRTPDGLAYIVMEWLDGQTLDAVLRGEGKLGWARTAELLRQMAAALTEAHAKHVIHRDLKPANVMLLKRPDGRAQVKVLDFGIGKVMTETGAAVSAIMGTPSYASPEQLQLGGRIDGRSDIYSLGVILYRVLGGALPFSSTSLGELIKMQLTQTPTPLRVLRPDTPPDIARLINEMLDKNPAQRPATAAMAAQRFTSALQQAGIEEAETRALPEQKAAAATVLTNWSQATEDMTAATREFETIQKSGAGNGALAAAPAQAKSFSADKTVRGRLLAGTALGLALASGAYGLYRYAFQDGARNEQQAAPVAQSTPTPAPTPTVVVDVASTNKRPEAQVNKPVTPKPVATLAPVRVEARRRAEGHFRRAENLYREGRYQLALRACNAALQRDPQHAGALALKQKLREMIKILGERE